MNLPVACMTRPAIVHCSCNTTIPWASRNNPTSIQVIEHAASFTCSAICSCTYGDRRRVKAVAPAGRATAFMFQDLGGKYDYKD